jgi:ribosomal protein S18 acetylase RimI-like enzyme
MATVNYQDRFAWVGMVLVDPDFRGEGIGTQLLKLSFEILRGIPAIRLDATPQGRPVYERLGFVAEYELSRMQIEVKEVPKSTRPEECRPMTAQDLEAVLELDRPIFGADRSPVLQWALTQAPEYAWVLEGSTGIDGYCFGRHGFNFEQIGPVIAQQPEGAERLVASCLRGKVGRQFILDPLHFSDDWLGWLSRMGFVHQRPFTRMYLGDNLYPGLPQKQWAIWGPEFG